MNKETKCQLQSITDFIKNNNETFIKQYLIKL